VVTDYDAIAHTYRETKSLPIKQYSEGFTLFQVLGPLRGLAVLDVACGDGYYTRAMRGRLRESHLMEPCWPPAMHPTAGREACQSRA
jgi:hypothetical protein